MHADSRASACDDDSHHIHAEKLESLAGQKVLLAGKRSDVITHAVVWGTDKDGQKFKQEPTYTLRVGDRVKLQLQDHGAVRVAVVSSDSGPVLSSKVVKSDLQNWLTPSGHKDSSVACRD